MRNMRTHLSAIVLLLIAGLSSSVPTTARREPPKPFKLRPVLSNGSSLQQPFLTKRVAKDTQSGRSRKGNDQVELPLDLEQVKGLIEVMPDAGLATQINKRGINFKLSEDVITDLKNLGAGPETIRVLRNLLANNHPPSVSLRANRTSVTQNSSVTLSATISEEDGDEVQYHWLSNAGRINGAGPTVELDPSQIDVSGGPVLVTVSVTVSDLKGGVASDRRTITVTDTQSASEQPEGEGRKAQERESQQMLLEAASEGKYLIVRLSGKAHAEAAPLGSIEATFSINNGRVEVQSLTGLLPGLPCRVEFVGLNNIAESSFKEPPGYDNQWGEVVLRLRIKDPRRLIRFAIGWKVLKESRAN